MTAAAARRTTPTDAKPGLIIFGLDDAGRAHASWFTEAEAGQAAGAAAQMGFAALQATTDEVLALAGALPRGKLFASGRAFVPFVRTELHKRLVKLAPEAKRPPDLHVVSNGAVNGNAATPEKKPGGAEKAPELPGDWAHIKVGHLVLAKEDDDEVWYAAFIAEAGPDDKFTLTWRDFPEEGKFVRHRSKLALLFPIVAKTAA